MFDVGAHVPAGARRALGAIRIAVLSAPRILTSSVRRWFRRPHSDTSTGTSGSTVFARARPNIARITEEYRYRQVISLSPSIDAAPAGPTGRIDVVVPYDGYHYFTRTAVDDIAAQLGPDDATATEPRRAIIGHLVLAGVRDARRVDGGSLAPAHGAIPLEIPIRGPSLNEKDLTADGQEAVLRIDYDPPDVGDHPFPLTVEASVFDPEDAPAVPDEFLGYGPTDTRVSRDSLQQVAFSSELRLRFVIHLNWPRHKSVAPTARIKRVALGWPTITSLTESFLRFDMGDTTASVQYDPVTSRLEWRNVRIDTASTAEPGPHGDADGDGDETGGAASGAPATKAERPRSEPGATEGRDPATREETTGATGRTAPSARHTGSANDGSDGESSEEDDEPEDDDRSDGRPWVLHSEKISLFVKHPGQLRRDEDLKGEIEVEVDDLFSGIDARLFDARGRRPPGSSLKRRTRLVVSFTMSLEEEFGRRRMKTTHTMQFDEIVPNRHRLDDIMSALRDRGFSVRVDSADDSDVRQPTWTLIAERTEGPNTVVMLLFVHGIHHRTQRRRAEAPGLHQYTSRMESGELRITIHAQRPRSSRQLTFEINKLRDSLDERFLHVQAQR